ncbi:MAG: fibrobacter succinogenes major paralogous domain-containing protein [Fibromonadales bacterium]|nr:fibrobacter succinogenes major paralogous domain-containing protein [Fibromonadales bacterium]
MQRKKNNMNTFTDKRDGKMYRTVKIGEQVWLAENLAYEAKGSKCYDNDESNVEKYGRLYNWNTAMKVCPKGWHLPSHEEWQTLLDFVGGKEISGKKLKTKSSWNKYKGKSGNGTDDFGFSALPCGGGRAGSFGGVGEFGSWWSSNKFGNYNAYNWVMDYSCKIVCFHYSAEDYLFSVRCIKDHVEKQGGQNDKKLCRAVDDTFGGLYREIEDKNKAIAKKDAELAELKRKLEKYEG